jgi:uncharacterized protein (DUF1499 family)
MTSLIVTLIGIAAVAIGSIGHRFLSLSFGPAFGLLGLGLLTTVVGVLMAAVRVILAATRHQPDRMGLLVAALVMGLLVIAIPASVVIRAQRSSDGVPPIHDISTDTADPPAFVDVLPLRTGALNKVEYGGPSIAEQQRKAYPDIVPTVLPIPPDQAFDRALQAVHDLHWDVAGSNRAQGRIEATDTTFWFGFKDDVVIRLRPSDGGTRVDVRSLSRVGGGDVGTNARRIRLYLAKLRSAPGA